MVPNTNMNRAEAEETTPSNADVHPVNFHQQAILNQVNNLAWLLDNSIRLPLLNYRIGLDAIVGLVPGLGDIAGALVSSYIVLQALRLGVPRATLARMVGNVAIEAAVGLIPLIGDVFDATFKANMRNVQLLNELFAPATSAQLRQPVAGRGAAVATAGTLAGLLTLVSGAGIAIFRGFLQMFGRETKPS